MNLPTKCRGNTFTTVTCQYIDINQFVQYFKSDEFRPFAHKIYIVDLIEKEACRLVCLQYR